jgi:hypothetical protein
MSAISKEGLLGEVEILLGSAPQKEKCRLQNNENFAYYGRLLSVNAKLGRELKNSNLEYLIRDATKSALQSIAEDAFTDIMIWLHRVSNDLRMETIGPVNSAIGHGMVFDYFEQISDLIKLASTDILFVDPYLDKEFVARYLTLVQAGASIRLLASKKLPTLVPAVELFCKQYGRSVQVRKAATLHDRYVLIDNSSCYQSGASFKDGGAKAPTTITQITDAFSAVRTTYEGLWASGAVML